MNDLVSVIIPVFNGERYLTKAVTSVIHQFHQNWECIIVDDGSTDNTGQICEDLAKRDPRIRCYAIANSGNYAARNYGIHQARGEWIQNLDCDDWLHPEKLSYQLNYLAAHPEYGLSDEVVLYTDYQRVYMDENENVLRKEDIVPGPLNNLQLLEKISEWSFSTDFPTPHWTLLIKRSILTKRPYTAAHNGFADVELVTRLLIDGVPFVYTPMTGIYYRIHNTQVTKNKKSMKRGYIDYLEFVQRYDPKWLRLNNNYEKLLRYAVLARNRKDFNRVLRLAQCAGRRMRVYGVPCFQLPGIKTFLFYYAVWASYLKYVAGRGKSTKRNGFRF